MGGVECWGTHQAEVDVGGLEAIEHGLPAVALANAHGGALHFQIGVHQNERLVWVRIHQLLYLFV